MIAVLVMQISNNLVTCVRCGKVCMAVFTSFDLERLVFSRTQDIRESLTCLHGGLLLPTKNIGHKFLSILIDSQLYSCRCQKRLKGI